MPMRNVGGMDIYIHNTLKINHKFLLASRNSSFKGNTGKLPDFGIFHIINTGKDKGETKRIASPKTGYGGTSRTPPINVTEQQR